MKVIFTLLTFITLTFASVLVRKDENQPLKAITQEEVNNRYYPAAVMSGAVSCGARSIRAFDCGPACDYLRNNGANVIYTTGDGNKYPFAYIIHMKSERALVVSHSPTNSSSWQSNLINDEFLLVGLDNDISNELPDHNTFGTLLHWGFQNNVLKSFDGIKSNLTAALDSLGDEIDTVKFTGHSTGATTASIYALAMTNLVKSRGKSVQLTTFGCPEIGNDVFANLMDDVVTDNARIVKMNDSVPFLPGIFPYQQTSGEVYLPYDDETDVPQPGAHCIGQSDDRCSHRRNTFHRDRTEHEGPYFGQTLGRNICQNRDSWPESHYES